jgi:tryptophan 2,3-dioxygenase
MTHDDSAPVTYWDYMRVPELLELQGGLERDESKLSEEEVVFIAVHQVYELWFKLMLRDLEAARDLFAQEHVPDDKLAGACRLLRRIKLILEKCAEQFELVETITTRDYLEFRDKLFPASGGQSVQFREVETLLGLDADERIPYVTGGKFADVLSETDGSAGWSMRRLRAREADTPTFKDAVRSWLHRTPIDGSCPGAPGDDAAVERFVESFLENRTSALSDLSRRVVDMAGSDEERGELKRRYAAEIESAATFLRASDVSDETERLRTRRIRAAALFIETYRELPLLAMPRDIVDGVLAVEHAFLVYRQRHARMAEWVIGRRVGTGGSTGVDYLDQAALKQRVFRDLWTVRTLLVRRDRLPDPLNAELYGFQFGAE